MKSTKRVVLMLGLAVLFLTGMDRTPEWTQKMREINEVLAEMVPDMTTASRIEKNALALSQLTQELQAPGMKAPDSDPSLEIFSRMLAEETRRAYRELKRGNAPYARSILKTVTDYCIACHTRVGDSARRGALTRIGLNGVGDLERAELYAGSLQFDLALEYFEKVVADPGFAENRSVDWERALRYALVISIRAHQDPGAALRILDRVQSTGHGPFVIHELSRRWRDSLLQWMAETPRVLDSEEGYFAEVLRLVAKARAIQRYPADHGADVDYLRATSVIHEMLRRHPEGKHVNEGLLLAGVCYEALNDLSVWTLHETYYTSCITRAPHTELARQCFQRLADSIEAAYSGSAGTFIPDDVQARLRELKKQADPQLR